MEMIYLQRQNRLLALLLQRLSVKDKPVTVDVENFRETIYQTSVTFQDPLIPRNYYWLIKSGMMYHINGTVSIFALNGKTINNPIFAGAINKDEASGYYNIPDIANQIIVSGQKVYFNGGVNSYAAIRYLLEAIE